MNANPSKRGDLTDNVADLGEATRKILRKRAFELAAVNGRSPQNVSKSDWEEAERELTGPEPKMAVGSIWNKLPAAPSEDQDNEEGSDEEKLIHNAKAKRRNL